MATATISLPARIRKRGISRVQVSPRRSILVLPDLPNAAFDALWEVVLDYRDARNRRLRQQIIRRRRELRRGRMMTHEEVWRS